MHKFISGYLMQHCNIQKVIYKLHIVILSYFKLRDNSQLCEIRVLKLFNSETYKKKPLAVQIWNSWQIKWKYE